MSKRSKPGNRTGKGPERAGRKELKGIIYLLVAVVLGVSLFSYDTGDPVAWIKTTRNQVASNLFGAVGASLAGWAIRLLGYSSFWLVALSLGKTFLFFSGHSPASSRKNLFVIPCLVISFAGILSLQWPHAAIHSAGGMMGYYLAGFMKGFLNSFGTAVLLLAVFIVTLMAFTQISFGWLLAGISSWLTGLSRQSMEYFIKMREKRRKKRVRERTIEEVRERPKPKVTILAPPPEPPKKAEQETFSFMKTPKDFKLPPLDLLNEPVREKDRTEIQKESLEMNARRLERKLADFDVKGEVVEISPGPVITMYELRPAPGVKISKVAGLSDDLALALRAPSVRIVAPIPGKAAIGIEIPNNQREVVCLQEILSSQAFQHSTHKLTIALGKDITGAPVVTDLTRMPHLLVAGATGTGKSVSLNAMVNSLLFKVTPEMVRFLIIDPKRIELSVYKDIPHLLHPVVTEPKEATRALRWTVEEMERRYMLLSEKGVRNIEAYNRKVGKEKKSGRPGEDDEKALPYIILVIDELADLMMTSSREVEEAITRLAQMARAAGIHLIIATQRPSVDVLTGIIKANFPARISFQVSSRVDSRTILDSIGAENLLGEGDMLFLPPGAGRIMRIHGAFISEEEVKKVTDFLRAQRKPDYDTTVLAELANDAEAVDEDIMMDEKYDKAVDLVVHTGQASISMIQRKLRVGYNRAARMIEAMEKEGIVGPSDGIRPREVFGRRGE